MDSSSDGVRAHHARSLPPGPRWPGPVANAIIPVPLKADIYTTRTNERQRRELFFLLTFFRAPSFVPMWCGDEEWGSHRDGGTRRAWAHAQHWTAVPCPRVGGLHRRSFAAACSAGDSSKLGTTMRDGYPESLLA